MKSFGRYHPATLIFYFLSILLISMFVWNPVIQLSSLFGGIFFCASIQNRRENLANIGFFLPLFFLVTVTNPLFSHNGITPLFFMNGNPVTLEAFVYGAAIAVMIIGVMLWCKCYNEIMTTDKFLYLFGKTIPKLSLIISMALRFVPLFKRQLKRVNNSQKALGLYSSKSYFDRLKYSARVLMAMITWSLENSIETSASMKARGYGIKGRTTFSLFRFYPEDGLLLGISIFLLLISLIGTALGVTSFYYYPKISTVDFSLPAVITYSSFTLLSFLPFIIEIKEKILWKYYVSKI